MKAIILLAVVAVASANPLGYGIAAPIAVGHAGIANTGVSSVARSDDGLGNYAFNYQIRSATGGNARAESGDAYGNKKGSYSLGVIDGRERVVEYVADGLGFRAAIKTNEPGTAPLQPAAVALSAPDSVGIAAATLRAAEPTLAGLAHGPAIGYGLAGPAYGLGAGYGYAGGLIH